MSKYFTEKLMFFIYVKVSGHQPNQTLPDGHFPEDTSPTDSSPMDTYQKDSTPIDFILARHTPNSTVARTDISPARQQFNHFALFNTPILYTHMFSIQRNVNLFIYLIICFLLTRNNVQVVCDSIHKNKIIYITKNNIH